MTTALFDTFAMTKLPSNRGWQAGCVCRDAVLLPQNTALRVLPSAGGRKWLDSNQDRVLEQLESSYLANGRHTEKLLLCVPCFSEL